MISIIIPVYNEEKTIRKALEDLSQRGNVEVLIVDGGSCDSTVKFVSQYPVSIINCGKNTALQMNEGARRAKGDILLFLHADSFMENDSPQEIERSIQAGFIGGCLSQKIQSGRMIYRFIENSGNLRARLSKIFYGDQAIFVRRDVFFRIGGFDNLKLFYGVTFSKKLRRAGETCVLNSRVYVSPRRWEKQGIIKATLINWLVTVCFMLRISPDILKKIYFDIR